MIFQFNNFTNQQANNNSFNQISQICANNHVCEKCPIYLNNGLHTNQDVTICHKVAEKFMKEKMRNGNK